MPTADQRSLAQRDVSRCPGGAHRRQEGPRKSRGGRWKRATVGNGVRLTDQTLSCAARAHVPKPTRRSACTHVSRAMQAARRRPAFDFTRRLGRRTEAGPRQLLRRVRPRRTFGAEELS